MAILSTKTVGYFVAILLVVVLYSALATLAGTASEADDVRSISYSDTIETILADNNSAQTLNNTPDTWTSATAINNSWLSFDGTNDYFDIDKGGIFDDNVTFSFWINVSAKHGDDHIIIWDNESLGQEVIHIGNNYSFSGVLTENFTVMTKPLQFEINGTTELIPTNVWTHIVVVINGSRAKGIYFNGANKITKGNLTAIAEYDAEYNRVGQTSEPFAGELDDFRLYNRSLTSAEILELNESGRVANSSLPSTGLVLWIPLNENSGTTLYSLNQSDFT